jgi:hypothetical protein
LSALNLTQLRSKAAALLAANSYRARTGIFRRQTYVLYRFQKTFALTFVGLSAFNTIMNALVIYELLGGRDNGVDLYGVVNAVGNMEPRVLWLFSMLLGLLLASFVLLYFVTVVATHRVAGPIAVMHKHLSSLLSGRYPAMRPLRQHDELKEFFADLKKLVDLLRDKDAEESKLLQQAIDNLSSSVGGLKAQEALASLKALGESKKKMVESSAESEVAHLPKTDDAATPIRAASH